MKWLLRGLAVTCCLAGFWLVVHDWIITGIVLELTALFAQDTVVAMGESELTDMERRMNERH